MGSPSRRGGVSDTRTHMASPPSRFPTPRRRTAASAPFLDLRTVLGASPPGANYDVCNNAGCNVDQVGDGVCNMNCFSAACRWDGGDCGHAPATWPPAVDTTIPQACRVLPAVIAGNTSQTVTLNVWEACNG